MNFLMMITFLYLIELSNSFNFIKYKSNSKIYMSCDYYIEQNLYIHYNDDSVEYINLQRYIINDDSNEDINLFDYTKIYNNRKLEPILIYSNHTFINEYLSNKYKHRLEFEMINNDYKTWNDIKEIILSEERYKR